MKKIKLENGQELDFKEAKQIFNELKLFFDKSLEPKSEKKPNYDKMEVLDKGTKFECAQYTLNGELHRLDGPAIVWADGPKWWYQNGKYHRTDGPAIEWPNGRKWWYIDGKKLTKEEFNERTRND